MRPRYEKMAEASLERSHTPKDLRAIPVPAYAAKWAIASRHRLLRS